MADPLSRRPDYIDANQLACFVSDYLASVSVDSQLAALRGPTPMQLKVKSKKMKRKSTTLDPGKINDRLNCWSTMHDSVSVVQGDPSSVCAQSLNPAHRRFDIRRVRRNMLSVSGFSCGGRADRRRCRFLSSLGNLSRSLRAIPGPGRKPALTSDVRTVGERHVPFDETPLLGVGEAASVGISDPTSLVGGEGQGPSYTLGSMSKPHRVLRSGPLSRLIDEIVACYDSDQFELDIQKW